MSILCSPCRPHPTAEQQKAIAEDFGGNLAILPADNIFVHTAPIHTPTTGKKNLPAPAPQIIINPQVIPNFMSPHLYYIYLYLQVSFLFVKTMNQVYM